MRLPIVLRIYKDKKLVEVRQFLEDQVIIGSPQAEVQVKLSGAQVGAIHAMIERRGDRYYLADLGSESGTSLNGQSILDEELAAGDQVQIGDYSLEFHIGAPKPKMPPPKTGSPGVKKVETPPLPDAPSRPSVSLDQIKKPDSQVGEPKLEDPPKKSSVLPESPVQPHIVTAGVPASTKPLDIVQPSAPFSAPASPTPFGRKRKGAGYAPKSPHTSVYELVKPSKGTIIEVLTVWRERVLQTYHFAEKRVITLGPEASSDVFVPFLRGGGKRAPLLRIDSQATLILSQGTDGEISDGTGTRKIIDLNEKGRLQLSGSTYLLPLAQGEMAVLHLGEDLKIVVRYVSHTPRPIPLPFIDFTGGEFLSVAVAVLLGLMSALFISLYESPLEEEVQEEIIAKVLVTPPKATQPPPPPPPPPIPAPPPKEERTQTKVPLPKEKQVAQAPRPSPNPGARAAPKEQLRPRDLPPKKGVSSAVKQGGAVKTSDKQGAQAKSQTKDISQSGIFSVFGGGGQKRELDQGYSGAGQLSGLADSATGRAGESENRPGEGLGSRFRDTGASGRGKGNYGVSGLDVTTSGRGSGDIGYGSGGLGGREGVQVVLGGADEEFEGTIDREAIRRVIAQHMRAIKACYQSALNRDPALFGKIVMSFEIGGQGQARNVKPVPSQSTLRSADVASCLVGRFSRMRFPTPPSGQIPEVRFPFVFSPQ